MIIRTEKFFGQKREQKEFDSLTGTGLDDAMLLGTNQTTGVNGLFDGDVSLLPMMDATDYADFLQYVNNYNWSGLADVVGPMDDDVSRSNGGSLFSNFGDMDGSSSSSSAMGLDPATFWLNFSGHSVSSTGVSLFPSILNDSAVDTVINNNTVDWIWEAGKLRIPLYRFVSLYFYLLSIQSWM